MPVRVPVSSIPGSIGVVPDSAEPSCRSEKVTGNFVLVAPTVATMFPDHQPVMSSVDSPPAPPAISAGSPLATSLPPTVAACPFSNSVPLTVRSPVTVSAPLSPVLPLITTFETVPLTVTSPPVMTSGPHP